MSAPVRCAAVRGDEGAARLLAQLLQRELVKARWDLA